MAHFSINPDRDEHLPRVYKGSWWMEADPTRVVGGTLEFVPGEGGTLELHGGLTGEDWPDSPVVVFGDADGKSVTIAQAYLTSAKRSWGDEEHSFEVWDCFAVYVGFHVDAGDDHTFDFFDLRTHCLQSWCVERVFETTRGDNFRELSVAIKVPEPIETGFDLGEVALQWLTSESMGEDRHTVDVTPSLTFRPTSPMTKDQAWDAFISPSLYFLSLVTGNADRILQLKAGHDGEQDDPASWRSAEILVQRWSDSPPRATSRHRLEYTLPYPRVKENLGALLTNWYDLCQHVRSALVTFFSVRMDESGSGESSFLAVVRGIETWHRLVHNGQQMDEEGFADLMGRVADNLNAEEKNFVLSRLSRANELSLKQRLEGLVRLAGDPLVSLVAEYAKKWLKRVVSTRNNLAHDSQVGNELTFEEVFFSEKTLSLAMDMVLLRHIGVDKEVLEESVSRSAVWRWPSAPSNPLRSAP